MSDPFDRIDAPTAAVEGGYVFHPDDRGGETNRGITVAVAREEGFTGAMRDMTAADAKAIRRSRFYVKPGIYRLVRLSEAIATELYDSAILHGPRVPITWLQTSLNAFNRKATLYVDLVADGRIGAVTEAALEAYLRADGAPAAGRMLKALNCLQGAFCIDITINREANESFIRGWLDNRVSLPPAR